MLNQPAEVGKTLDVSFTVWGEKYATTMLQFCFPSMLAPGNLPECASMVNVRVNVLTRPEDEKLISGHPIVAEMRKYVDVQVLPVLLDISSEPSRRYQSMRNAHRMCIEKGLEERSIVSLPAPDAVFSDGSMSFALRKILERKRVVLMAGPRAVLDEAEANLGRFRDSATGVMRLPARELVSFASRNPHDICRILYWDSLACSRYPDSIFWRVSQDSFIYRSFDFVPLMMDLDGVREEIARCTTTIDGFMIEDAGFRPDELYVCTNSDDLCAIELSSRNHEVLGASADIKRNRILAMIGWTPGKTTKRTREQFRKLTVIYRGRDDDDCVGVINRSRRQIWLLLVWLRCLDVMQPTRSVLRRITS